MPLNLTTPIVVSTTFPQIKLRQFTIDDIACAINVVYGFGTAGTPTTIAIGASPFVYINTTNSDIDVVISGGSVSDISVNGASMGAIVIAGTWTLHPGDKIQVTYTVVPTMTTATSFVYSGAVKSYTFGLAAYCQALSAMNVTSTTVTHYQAVKVYLYNAIMALEGLSGTVA